MTLPMTIIGAAVAPPDSTASFIINTVPLVLVFVIFYMLMIRPQQRRMKSHQSMLAALKRGDTVILSSGVHGKIVRVEDTTVGVEISTGITEKVRKAMIS